MNIVTNIKDWQDIRKNISTKSVGFVPTMGHLHEGHLSLCERSKKENDVSVVSIFINPTQFNQTSDFNHYPRTIENDIALLKNRVDYLLLPTTEEIYADNYSVKILETELSTELEGKYRPGHFEGMLTVVLKLLNLAQAHRAYFGEKDFQQVLLVKKMVSTLFLSCEIVSCATIRADDGLALSSRNSRLSREQRQKATCFPRLLNSSESCESIIDKLNGLGFKVDYIVEKWQRRLGAVWLDDIRLIDNITIK